jgi:hypothetical protein
MLRTLPTESAALSDQAVLPLAQATAAQVIAPAASEETTDASADSLFEHFAWLYIFCRERLFRDDTERMIASLWSNGKPAPNEKVIELGCVPGFLFVPSRGTVSRDFVAWRGSFAEPAQIRAGKKRCARTEQLSIPKR